MTMAEIPNLAGVATSDLVENIGGGNFKASYINWSRTLHLLRTHAPGWLPELVPADRGLIHEAPVGGYLMIRFRHADGTTTPEVPQAIMDSRNAAIPVAKVTARDVTDTHVRGVCKAAAVTFGLAYELWAKIKLESGYAEEEPEPQANVAKINPTAGVWDALEEEQRTFLQKIADSVLDMMPDASAAMEYIESQQLETDEKVALWTRLDSKTRTALKKAQKEAA